MARLRYNGLTATLGAPLTSTDTAITFAAALSSAAGAVPTISGGDTIALSILNSAGNVSEIVSLTAYTSGATTGTITRAQEGTTAAAHAAGNEVVHSPTAADFTTSGGSVLATLVYNPSPNATYTTTSSTMVAVDAANLAITFTAPASGRVVVTPTGLAGMNATGSIMYWGLLDGSTLVTNSSCEMYYNTTASQRLVADMIISGLTPGTSYTYKWAWMRALGSATLSLNAGKFDATSFGPMTMKVVAA